MKILHGDIWSLGAISATSSADGFPYSNTQHPHLSRVWSPEGKAAEQVTVDLGSSLYAESVAVMAHNLTPNATVRLLADDIGTFAAPNINLQLDPSRKIMIGAFPGQTRRYWALSIDDPTNTADLLIIGRIFVGLRWEPIEQIDDTLKLDFDDSTARSSSITGQEWTDEGVVRRIVNASFGVMFEQTRQELEALWREVGSRIPIIVTFDDLPGSGIGGSVDRLYCVFDQAPSFMPNRGWMWKDGGLVFKEVL